MSSCHPPHQYSSLIQEQQLAAAGKSPEPTSVLYNRSPSPPTSSSLGSSLKPDHHPIPPPNSIAAADVDDDWESVLMISGDMFAPHPQDSSFLRWIMVDAQPHAIPHNPFPFEEPNQPQDEDALVEHLLDAARHLDAGDITTAKGILARLNHLLPSPSPLLRAAALLRDAFLLPPPPPSSPPLDVPLKLAAHKALADASPTVQFAAFTSTQAILDALAAGNAARRVHIVDFDLAFGAHWPPLIHELARRSLTTSIKLTALVSPASRHPLELHLTYETLTRFAADLAVPFEFNAVAFDPLAAITSPATMGISAAPDEAVAVHLPSGSGTFSPAPAHVRLVKELRPAVVVSVDHGCERGDLPLPHHALNILRSCAALLESLDAAPAASQEMVSKVEQFILRPRVEHLALFAAGGGGGGEKAPPLQSMLASAGFAPLQLSNAAEAQAECLLRRTSNDGFHVEKKTQAALALWWRRSELVSVSAWRC
uniref:Uncharacterized protein n=1 Tax=Leersia perrieri TaxID=77586 RepID=A0A0D9WKU4_9ORYZ